MTLETNIKTAFQGVKKDILEMKDQILRIAEKQEKLEASLEDLDKKKTESLNEEAQDSNQEDSLVQIREIPKEPDKKPTKKKPTKNPVKKAKKTSKKK